MGVMLYGEHPPVLDMANVHDNDEEVAWACREWGVFYVVNHSVKEDTITQMEEEGNRLFNLPLDVKLQHQRLPGSFSGYGKPSISDRFNTLLWSECFTYNRADHANTLENVINRHPFREYYEALHGLALRLFALLSRSIGIDKRQAEWMKEGTELGFVHMNHYSPCPHPSKTMGMPPHTDSSILTIIHQRKRGLQIFRNNRWMDVPPLHNTLVVQLGDMLQIMSNDIYKSVVHRAVLKKDDSRLSIAYFLAPPLSVKVKPCVRLRGGEAPIYGDVSWQEVVEAKGKHPQGAVDKFRIV